MIALAIVTGCATTPPPDAALARSEQALAAASAQYQGQPALQAARENQRRAERAMSDREYKAAGWYAERVLADLELAASTTEAAELNKEVADARRRLEELRRALALLEEQGL